MEFTASPPNLSAKSPKITGILRLSSPPMNTFPQKTGLDYILFRRESDPVAVLSRAGRPPGRWPNSQCPLRPRRLDQHVDAAGGDRELAPRLVVDRHAVGDAFGAGAAFGVAGDQHRLVRARRG